MANVDTPFGAKPVAHRNGGVYTGAYREYSVPSGDGTALYIGDFVKLAGTGQTIDGRVYNDVARAATGDVLVGPVIGVRPITRASTIYREASTQRIVQVADDPSLIFEMQEGSSGTALAANDIGLNIDFVVAAGSATTGLSGTQLNNATEATTNTLDLHLLAFVNREDNAIGYSAKWWVTINRHQYSNQVAGI